MKELYSLGTTVELTGALALWAVILLRASTAFRSRQQRMLLLAVIGLAGSVTVYLDPVSALINRNLVFAQSCGLIMNIWGVLSSALILVFVLAATSRSRAGLVYGVTAVVSVVLVVLNATVAPHAGCVTSAAVPVPWYSAFWWILVSAHLVATIPCAILCGRYGYRASEDRSLRTGLLLLAAGFVSSSVFWGVLVFGYLLFKAKLLGVLFPLNIGMTAWLMTFGAAVPLVLGVNRRVAELIARRRLRPLWQVLVEQAPHVALDVPTTRTGLLTSLRLYRCVIEIRDAILVLRDYVTVHTVGDARDHVQANGVPPDEVEATVTACWLEAAIRAKIAGAAPEPISQVPAPLGGNDLRGEVDFLVVVARARRSALVTDFIAAQAQIPDKVRRQS
jgi:hypothetical protein